MDDKERKRAVVTAIAVGGMILGCLTSCDATLDPPAPLPAPGRVSVLATGHGGDTGWWPEVRIDEQDHAHVTWCDSTLGDAMYATRAPGGAWQPEPISTAGAVGKYITLGLDAHGRPAVLYYNQDAKFLDFATRRDDGTWSSEHVDWGDNIGVGGVLLFDADNVAHAFYYSQRDRFLHATRKKSPQGDPWTVALVAAARGGYYTEVDVVRRADGFWLTFVDWSKREGFFLARPAPDGLVVEPLVLEKGAGWRSALVFGQHAELELIYTLGGAKELRLARRVGVGFESLRLARKVNNMAAAVTRTGDFAIAYQDVHAGQKAASSLKLLRRDGVAWRHFAVDDDGPLADYLGVALDSQGRAVIAYHANGAKALRIYDEAAAK